MKRKPNCLATILFLIYLALLVWIILFKLCLLYTSTCLAAPNFHPVLSRQRIFPYNLLEHSLFRPDDRTHSKLCFCLLLLCSSFYGKVLRTAFGF